MQKSTRIKLICDYICKAKQHNGNVLHTNSDVRHYYFYIFDSLKKQRFL